MSEMRADILREIDRVQRPVLADELNEAIASLADAESRIQATSYRLGLLVEGSDPTLPAPLTEDAIVAALKADPAMAGRVMACCGFEFSGSDTAEFAASASSHADKLYIGGRHRPGLQSLAVALAAASYRG